MSAARLTLNSGHPAIERLLRGCQGRGNRTVAPDPQLGRDPADGAGGLDCDDVVGLDVDPETTTTSPASCATCSAGSGRLDSPSTLQGWRRTDPARIEVHLQHHVEASEMTLATLLYPRLPRDVAKSLILDRAGATPARAARPGGARATPTPNRRPPEAIPSTRRSCAEVQGSRSAASPRRPATPTPWHGPPKTSTARAGRHSCR